jgi:hypothetical protein
MVDGVRAGVVDERAFACSLPMLLQAGPVAWLLTRRPRRSQPHLPLSPSTPCKSAQADADTWGTVDHDQTVGTGRRLPLCQSR